MVVITNHKIVFSLRFFFRADDEKGSRLGADLVEGTEARQTIERAEVCRGPRAADDE